MSQPVSARVLGLLHIDPLRGPVALRTLDAVVGLPTDADDAGVATVVDGAALLSRTRLAVGAVASWAVAVGAPRGRATLVQVGGAGGVAGPAGLYRARAYAAAVVGGPVDDAVAQATRERLLAGLPDFLRRCVVGPSEGEAVFLAALARLHARGLLDACHDNAGALLDAVVHVLDDVDSGSGPVARHATITNGVEILHLTRGAPAAVLTIAGLDDGVAGAVDPSFADSSAARERNRRYRAVVVLAGLGGDLSTRLGTRAPRGVQGEAVASTGALVIGRDLTVRRH
ncbi:MAG: hypothetical protein FJ137_11215 [Deltaproteobacteria bacterium]|nr:hypothetical protein [Deltaproteobacteria bacterium]